ncbi:YehR family protein [Streptococcus iniae]
MKNRKLVSLLMLVISVLFLVACQSKQAVKEKVVYFEMTQNGSTVGLTYYYKGDKVTRQSAKTKATYTALGVDSKEAAKKELSSIAKQYQGVKGLKESIDYKDDHILETVEVDYAKADMKQLSKIPGIALATEDGKVPDYVSYKKTKKMLEDKGFKKVDKLSIN